MIVKEAVYDERREVKGGLHGRGRYLVFRERPIEVCLSTVYNSLVVVSNDLDIVGEAV